MDTPSTNNVVIIRTALTTSPIHRLPTELRQDIMHLITQTATKITVVPRVLTQETPMTPLLRPNEPQLVYIPTNRLAKTCTQLYDDSTTALKAQIRSCRASTLVLHVLDFDFEPITEEILAQFTDLHRTYYNDAANTIRVEMTITDAFARLPDEPRLWEVAAVES